MRTRIGKARRPSGARAAVLAAALIGLGAGPGGCFGAKDAAVATGVPARRGPMKISVVQRGSLEAKNALSVKSEMERGTTIIYLIPEGRHVEPGDLLVELDVAEMVDRRTQQEISVQNADAAHTKAVQQYEIQKSENASAIDQAVNAVQFAEIDLRKYLEGDWPQELQVAQEEIVLAEEEKARAEERLNWSRDLAEKGFLTRTELEGDQLAFNRAEITLQQAKRAKELLIEFDNPRQKKQLEANLEEARRELDRQRMRAEARLVDFEAAMKTSEKKLELERDDLAKTNAQIAKARIVSPVAGMAVHTREDRGRYGNGEPLQEGSEVHERQEILTIPTADGMVAQASVHESVLKQIVPGLPCIVRVDALPGVEFDGTVEFVAPLPDKNSWWANPDQRLFKTEISIDRTHPDVRPGMSCGVEFLVDEIDSALQIPLQSVIVHEGRTICFVEAEGGPVQRPIRVGRRNELSVEVLSGLEEGELVLMSPPKGFTPKGSGSDAEGRRARGAAADEAAAGGAPQSGADQAPGAGPQARGGDGGGRPQGARSGMPRAPRGEGGGDGERRAGRDGEMERAGDRAGQAADASPGGDADEGGDASGSGSSDDGPGRGLGAAE